MLKGIPQEMRNQGWHIKHSATLKRREHIRKIHLALQKAFLSKTREQQRKADESSKKAVDRDLKHGKLYWFLWRWYFKITNPFRRFIRLLKQKHAQVKT